MQRVITYDQVAKIADDVVDRIGFAHVESSARYFDVDTGGPTCLVGYILSDLGVSVVDAHRRIPTWPKETDVNYMTFSYLTWDDVHFEDKAVDFLDFAQFSQDLGDTWGIAVVSAKDEVRKKYGN